MTQENDSFLDNSKVINVSVTIFITVFGLCGHFLTICVYSKKKYRFNSNSVYLLCLSINDGLFLIVHFFEDTIRTIQSIDDNSQKSNFTLHQNISSSLFDILNIIDSFDSTCRFINYMRYLLRFVSAYIIVAFTLQRLLIICTSMNNRFKTEKSAWLTVFTIVTIGLVINLWTPFFFEIRSDETQTYCDIKKELKEEYFYIAIIYIFLMMFLPIAIIFICNTIILIKTIRAHLVLTNPIKLIRNSKMIEFREKKSLVNKTRNEANFNKENNERRLSENLKIKEINKMAKILLFISFAYAVLNLPYFITWCLFFREVAFNSGNARLSNNLFAAVQLSEIFFILNYSINFYINYVSSYRFRKQIKNFN